MGKILPSQTAKIRALTSQLVSTIEHQGKLGLSAAPIREGCRELVETYREVLSIDPDQVGAERESLADLIRQIDAAYTQWRELRCALTEAIESGYRGSAPRKNMLLDSLLFELDRDVGDPLTQLYTRFHALWQRHLERYPWDGFLTGISGHADREETESLLKALTHGDELDREESISTLAGRLKPVFAHLLASGAIAPAQRAEVVAALATRPEIVVASDYWQHRGKVRLVELLCRERSPESAFFSSIREIYSLEESRQPDDRWAKLTGGGEEQRWLRCLALHPSGNVRSYAAAKMDRSALYLSASAPKVPCAAVLSLLQRVAGSENFTGNFRSLFFNTIYRRLLTLVTRTDVLYAQGMVRILASFDFFVEDEYFEKLALLIDYIGQKERIFAVKEKFLDEHLLRIRKARRGRSPQGSTAPDFSGVPLVVLRKLARDGHFWLELSAHPLAKIAKETLPYINTADRALLVVGKPGTNQEVLRELGKRRELFRGRSARLSLLSNPRTPVSTSRSYLADLGRDETELLLRRSTVHPELRQLLQKRLERGA